MSSLSASTIARWNAISNATTTSQDGMSRKVDNADGGDDTSFVSRTSFPDPDGMDVDPSGYDEYSSRPEQEVVTTESKIKPSNIGFAMLAKLGWKEGQPLGLSADGRIDPVPFKVKQDSAGLGKISQDYQMIETTVAQRRELDSERMRRETEEQKRDREDSVARRAALQNEINDTLKPFYCSLCDKQFKNVAQYDEHTNSYAHHHKARFKDMQANARIKPQEEVDRRKEKERKREERELRKLAAAQGIKIAKPVSTTSTVEAAPPSVNQGSQLSDFKGVGGWASIASTSGVGVKKAGWSSISGPSSDTAHSTSVMSTAAESPTSSSGAPAFRTGGWSRLNNEGQPSPLLMSPPTALPAFEPPPPPPPPSIAPPPPPPLNVAEVPPSSYGSIQTPSTELPAVNPLPPRAVPSKQSSWQQFQKGTHRHK
ncbi:hypothetical protein FISHEDRAFT_66935 [Fistulina hepatica ATCC 64428]|uniref:G-patch domain-containing protein n=1 Tax=Fistulina hepatica ATCC 64428 TaxID=1128425 RepID=A0A0D7A627_9AGAR|nr:hypothetical protein FISHEDRAFT_66935 [Fistulina hepatica ATCC 64428]